jgi:head-to-tail connecting protein
MNLHDTCAGRWGELDNDRKSFLGRCEKYSAFTIPKICPPDGYNQNGDELQHDYQSLGAQAVNHLANKLMLALFAPSRPFFRLDPTAKLAAQMDGAKMSRDDIASELAQAEKDAVNELDKRALRPKLYNSLKHLIITGNALIILGKDSMRVLGIKNYVVKRGVDGEVLEGIVKEMVNFQSLEGDVVAEVQRRLNQDTIGDAKGMVAMYKWIRKCGEHKYEMDTWIDDVKLSTKYAGKYNEKNLPFRFITWDLESNSDYGTGLVEDYTGDFASLSILSQATVQAAILASEFRWLVNPAGQTSATDFEKSQNGAALSGVAGDVVLVQSGKANDLQVNIQIARDYINRIGSGFLLQSAVTRQAERVTAEEIRMTAEELESSLGGAYSRIAVDVQVPMAYWLMKLRNRPIAGTDIEPTIVTGLAALSRAGDRDNLVLFLQDVAMLSQVQPAMQARMRVGAIQAAFAAARGLMASQYLLSDAEFAAQQAAAQQQNLQQTADEAVVNAGAENAAQTE